MYTYMYTYIHIYNRLFRSLSMAVPYESRKYIAKLACRYKLHFKIGL